MWALDGGIEAFREGVLPAERCARGGSSCWSSVGLERRVSEAIL